VRLGVVGAGFVAQVVHLPCLADERARFAVAALAEPDEAVRRAVARRHGIPAAFARHEEMLAGTSLDAVLICSPDATHAEVVLDALASGVHVLVEKPLCLTVADADRIVAERNAAGVVVQVGYMKRFDPAYEALVADLRTAGDELVHLARLTYDPGMAEHFGHVAGSGRTAEPEGADRRLEGFVGALVHDVNAVHGILDALGVDVSGAAVVDGFGRRNGSLAGGTVALAGGLRWSMAWIRLPQAGTFAERIELFGSEGVRALAFPAPYLRHAPTTYSWTSGGSGASRVRTFRSWRESYARQLEHFHDCVLGSVPCRTPPEQARADVALLRELHDATLAVPA